MIIYNVYRGEYPFDELIGQVQAPADNPDAALQQAITAFAGIDPHPVVEPRAKGMVVH
jgi:hypothetical protein